MQAYSDPKREQDSHASPHLKVWYVSASEFAQAEHGTWQHEATCALEPSPFSNLTDCSPLDGWYWWSYFPGCIPDDYEPIGPFNTQEEAIKDAHD